MSHVLLGFITAPLMTLSISMQASIPTNRITIANIVPDQTSKEPSRLT